MSMLDWAEKEVKAACKKENPDWDGKSFDYGCSCYMSALKAYKSLAEDGHSGFSWSVTREILIKLLYDIPLSPITEDDFAEVEPSHFEWETDILWSKQCPRRYSLFQECDLDRNLTYHDVDRTVFVDENGMSWTNRLASQIIDEEHPITLPYKPTKEPYKVYGYGFMVDLKTNRVWYERGTYNFYYFSHYTEPDGKEHILNMIFVEDNDGKLVEITDGEDKLEIIKNSMPVVKESKKRHSKFVNGEPKDEPKGE